MKKKDQKPFKKCKFLLKSSQNYWNLLEDFYESYLQFLLSIRFCWFHLKRVIYELFTDQYLSSTFWEAPSIQIH